jgi:ABC-2 type transport system permease protein
VLRTPVHWNAIVVDLVLQAGYVAVFASAAWARFTTKDVLAQPNGAAARRTRLLRCC